MNELEGFDLPPQGRDAADLAESSEGGAAGENVVIVFFDVIKDAGVENRGGADGELTFALEHFHARP